MKKISLSGVIATFTLLSLTADAQPSATPTAQKAKKDWSKIDLSSRNNDHFMIQFGVDNWAGKPDSIRTKGFSKHFNMYLMLDKPFKVDPRFSVGFGVGIGSSNILLENTLVDITGKVSPNRLFFQKADSITHYKKYKMVNVWLEAPVELRYISNPENGDNSWKFAIGAKVGTMIDAHTKGKELIDKNGNTLANQTKTIVKEKSRRFFNSTRLAATVRIGFGHFSLYGAYQITNLIKDGAGPELRPYSIGLCLSGL